MSNTIFYGYENQIRKGAETFVKRGDVLNLMNKIVRPEDTIIIAEEPDDSFLKSLAEEYGVQIVKASDVPNGLSFEQELAIEHLQTMGYDFEKAAETLELPLYEVALSKAFNASSRIEKAAELAD